MEDAVKRLIDEARRQPVKNAFRLGLEFMDRNRTLAAMTMGFFFVLTLLEMVPLLGLVASVALGVFAQSVQIYVGRTFAQAENIEAFVNEAEQASFKTFLTRHQAPAFGAWLGWVALSMLFMVLFIVFLGMSGTELSGFNEASLQDERQMYEMILAVMGAGTPVLLLSLLLAYVYPIAQGRVIMSDSFGEAFKAVFSIFTPSVWASAMRGEYFSFALLFSLALIGIGMLVTATMMLLMLIPFIGAVLIIVWMIFLMYAFMLILGIANTLAREIAEG
jgi:hypothetical protein